MNSIDLVTVADELATPQQAGAPLEARLRRSISTAYYAVFHSALDLIEMAAGPDPQARTPAGLTR